jgi:L-2-hydroxyglutarate oxidase
MLSQGQLDKVDCVIIGAGIIGLSSGIAILEQDPSQKVLILEKESNIGLHASARNSGVLHAGFYYSPESLKAKFCKEGNAELKKMAKSFGVHVNICGKVVVATNQVEADRLRILHSHGIRNGVEIELLSSQKLHELEPTANTTEQFIWSPTTGVLDSKLFLSRLSLYFQELGGKLICGARSELKSSGGEIYVKSNGSFVNATRVINAAGSYSDDLARQIEVGLEYGSMPFRGSYRKSQQNPKSKRLIYPVPHPINPFLGVHTIITSDGSLKIGPTAIPVLSRENYNSFENVKLREIIEISRTILSVAKGSKHDIFEIIKAEFPLLFKKNLIENASKLSKEVVKHHTWQKAESGIRSQLVNLQTGELVQDFLVKRLSNSLHFLNVVSPGWTSALPFTRHFVTDFLKD